MSEPQIWVSKGFWFGCAAGAYADIHHAGDIHDFDSDLLIVGPIFVCARRAGAAGH